MQTIGLILYVATILAAVGYVVSILRSLAKAAASHEDVQVLGASVGVVQLLLLLLMLYATTTGLLSRTHLLWMFPVWLILHPLTLMAHQIVAARGVVSLISSSVSLLLAGGLTVLQYSLSNEGSVWVSFRVGGFPVPLIGLTFLLSLVAMHLVVVAIVYLPLRAIFGGV